MLRLASGSLRTRAAAQSCRRYNFASEGYAACFGNLDKPNSKKVREESIRYLESFDAQEWYRDPVVSILNGEQLTNGTEVVTVDAFNKENGKLVEATTAEVDRIIHHMQTYKAERTDYREEIRKLEQRLLTEFAGLLVGNQALDFKKQDGITEIEESVEANTVERRLNDLLFQDEQDGKVVIDRSPHICGCVSNFTNFLDLFRKTIRNLELGVPVVVFSRSNTTQHTYRWTVVLAQLMKEAGLPDGLLTHASCSVEEQRRIMQANPGSPLNFTGSRPIAAAIKEVCPLLNASTGGPNTMVVDCWNEDIAAAVRMSTSIENSGQCTAMRHLVGPPSISAADVEKAFEPLSVLDTPAAALRASEFAAVLDGHPFTVADGYTKHSSVPMAYRVGSGGDLPGDDIDEMWRQVYLDVSTCDDATAPASVSKLSSWIVKHQPISLAVNGSTFQKSFEIAKQLFEKTALVVYTVGAQEQPALTAQARPQDAEIFGEFPPRRALSKYTNFVVVGPTPTPGYNAHYSAQYLEEQANLPAPPGMEDMDALVCATTSSTRGYLRVLQQYLKEAAVGPRRGPGVRTNLWGLQRPPLGSSSIIRCSASSTLDEVAPLLVPFLATNARSQVSVSVDPSNAALVHTLRTAAPSGLAVVPEERAAFLARADETDAWNVVEAPAGALNPVLVGHHCGLLFPLGHIKCTRSDDEAFLEVFRSSEKWLRAV